MGISGDFGAGPVDPADLTFGVGIAWAVEGRDAFRVELLRGMIVTVALDAVFLSGVLVREEGVTDALPF